MTEAPRPVHFYHVWAGDQHHGSAWRKPAVEHFAALRAAEFDGEVRAGVVGGLPEQIMAFEFLRSAWPESSVAAKS